MTPEQRKYYDKGRKSVLKSVQSERERYESDIKNARATAVAAAALPQLLNAPWRTTYRDGTVKKWGYAKCCEEAANAAETVVANLRVY